MNPHDDIEDAAFEDFLKGEGDLARQLKGMPQPPVPEALSAAILTRAAADLDIAARVGVSANDAVHDGAPAAPPARHYLRRARVPLGLAASVVLALFVVRGLMPQAFAPEVRQDSAAPESAPPRDVVVTTVAIAEPAPPSPLISPPSASVRAAKPVAAMPPSARSAPMADIAAAPAPVLSESPLLAPETAEAKVLAPQVLGYAAAPSMAVRYASPPAPPEPFSPAPATVLARSPFPAHAALPGPEVTSASPAMLASAWLARMAEMLKAGQTKEAHAEWLKFRMRYPDTDVPPELQRQLEAVN